MNRLAALMLALILALALLPSTAASQGAPEYRLGFKALAAQIPQLVGQPVEDEHYGANGDSLQQTTTGLMVWRKADNWTAFTDGATTWINGPLGLQSRPNDQRFAWEASTPSVLGAQSRGSVDLAFSQAADGSWVGQGVARNTTGAELDFEVNAIGLSSGGAPLVDAQTVYQRSVPSGESRQFSVRVSTGDAVVRWRWSVATVPSASRASYSLDVGTSSPLRISGTLLGAAQELRQVNNGEWLLRVAAERGVRIVMSTTDSGVLGSFEPRRDLLTVSSRLESSTAWVRATVLAHELQHVADTTAGMSARTSEQCYKIETAAFQRQADVWDQLWHSNFPRAADSLHAEMNDIANTVTHDPEAFADQLTRRYRAECGPLQ